MNDNIVVKTLEVHKIYKMGEVEVAALAGVSIDIKKGEFVSIMGPSGCGKSTLMHIIGCLDRPTRGDIYLDEVNIGKLDDDALANIRNKKVGFVFQTFNLLPKLTAVENIELPLIYAGINSEERRKRASALLDTVGLKERANHKPSELSGGQSQRVAVARALANNPSIILADEPTGNLDSKSGAEIISLFSQLNGNGITIILVTHEQAIAEKTKRIIRLKDGRIIFDEPR